MRYANSRCLSTLAAFVFVANGIAAVRAQEAPPIYRDVETKYIFGFTGGSGIGLEGEKEISIDTAAKFGKRDGRYWGSETKLNFEFTPNQYVQFEFGPFMSAHSIHNVTGFDDRDQVTFGGVFGEARVMLLDRGPSSPLAVTLSAEPEWKRIGSAGTQLNIVELELKLNADYELVKNRLYLGANLLYEPEATHDPDGVGAGWEMESTGGVSAALSYRITPSVFVGAEVWYLRHYDGAWLNVFGGDAVFVGPTLFAKLGRKMFVSAAWNTQISGREVDNPEISLNLHEFSRHRARLKFSVEL